MIRILIVATVHKQFSLNGNKLKTLEKVRIETTEKNFSSLDLSFKYDARVESHWKPLFNPSFLFLLQKLVPHPPSYATISEINCILSIYCKVKKITPASKIAT